MKLKEAELVQALIELCDKNGSKTSEINHVLPNFSKSSIKRALQRAVKAGVVQANAGTLRFRLSSKAREKLRERSAARAARSKNKLEKGNHRSKSQKAEKSTNNRKASKSAKEAGQKGRKGRRRRKSKKGKKDKKGKKGKKGKRRSRGRKGKKEKKGKRGRGRSRGRKGKKGTKRGRKPLAKEESDAAPSEGTGRRWGRFFKWNNALLSTFIHI